MESCERSVPVTSLPPFFDTSSYRSWHVRIKGSWTGNRILQVFLVPVYLDIPQSLDARLPEKPTVWRKWWSETRPVAERDISWFDLECDSTLVLRRLERVWKSSIILSRGVPYRSDYNPNLWKESFSLSRIGTGQGWCEDRVSSLSRPIEW